jgi:Na+-transporting methylmalonyl-CoA/oxaloacetate decarboxylase gamma subunit
MDLIQIIIQRIVDGQGLEIALAGMITVFLALTLISGCIAILPKVLAMFAGTFPETPTPQPTISAPANEEEAIAAAVGYLHHIGKSQKQ